MRERGLTPCQPGPKRLVTTVAGDAGDLPDLVRRDFTAEAPGRKLCGDITYIRTWDGWLYLATVLDCFSKKVVGYAMSDRMTSDLVVAALDKAVKNVTFIPGLRSFTATAEVSTCQQTSPRALRSTVRKDLLVAPESAMAMRGPSPSTEL